MISKCISNSTSPNEHFECGYPYSNALLCMFTIKIFVSSQIEAFQAAYHPTKCDLTIDVKQFPTVNHGYTVIQSNVTLQ